MFQIKKELRFLQILRIHLGYSVNGQNLGDFVKLYAKNKDIFFFVCGFAVYIFWNC